MDDNQHRQTSLSSSSSAWRTNQEQHKCSNACFRQQDKSNLSRRSIDWRDSGIVIDEDNHLCQTFGAFDSQSSIISDHEIDLTSTQTTCKSSQAAAGTIKNIALSQDEDGDTILHLAVVGFTLAKARDLIGVCDLNASNNMMQTPLHVATLANRLEMVQMLISSGAKLDSYDRRGNTPLHLACQKGLVDIAETILDAIPTEPTETNSLSRAQMINSCNFDGFTCLHLAAMGNHSKIIQLLVLKCQANLSVADSKSGETILHKAIRHLNVDLVASLLDHEPHNLIYTTDYSGRLPLNTVEILQEPSTAVKNNQDQLARLSKMRELIENKIKECVARSGCCVGRGERNVKLLNLPDSASSSSDYSDSD